MGERLLIVGAGIAGLTTALVAARSGFSSVICERATELSEVGAGLQLSPNAGRVLDGLGLGEAIARHAIEPRSIDVRDGATGGTVTALPTALFRERYGYPYRVIHRADLQRALLNAVKATPAVKLVLGATPGEVLDRPQERLVKLKGGRGEVISAVAIIGADGVWSTTRTGLPGAAEAVPTGRTAWRTVIPRDNLPDALPADRVCLWLGTNAHCVLYPVADGAAMNIVAIVQENWDKPGWTAHGDYRELARHFGSWCASLTDLLKLSPGWQKWALCTVDPRKTWSDGTTTLIGDAAHAMRPFLAQGAAMAIEDAAVLGHHLTDRSAPVASRLKAYEAERKPRVTRVWRSSERTGEHYHATGFTARMRDSALSLLGPRLLLARNDWIYRWQEPAPGDGRP